MLEAFAALLLILLPESALTGTSCDAVSFASDFASLRQALQGRVGGGFVCVDVSGAGTIVFSESFSIRSSAKLKIFSRSADLDSATVLSGDSVLDEDFAIRKDGVYLFRMDGGELHLENLTVANAGGEDLDPGGGGAVGIVGTRPKLFARRVTFQSNYAWHDGGAVSVYNPRIFQAYVIFEDCTFQNNVARHVGGTAVQLRARAGSASTFSFIRCKFLANQYLGSMGGSAVRIDFQEGHNSVATFRECLFEQNYNGAGSGGADVSSYMSNGSAISFYGTQFEGVDVPFARCGSSCSDWTDTHDCEPLDDCWSCRPCNHCSRGQFRDSAGQCSVCPGGTFQAATSEARACEPCPEGRFVADDGERAESHFACEACASGFSSPRGALCCDGHGMVSASEGPQVEAGSACSVCPEGTFSRDFRCQVCQAGRFANSSGETACHPCPAGTSLADDGVHRLAHALDLLCAPCEAGRSSDVLGARACEPCGPGSYAGGSGQTACQECPRGYVADGLGDGGHPTGDLHCEPCPAGKMSSYGRSACTNCSQGRYNGDLGKDTCELCPPGSAPDSESRLCVHCDDTHIATPGDAACQRCGSRIEFAFLELPQNPNEDNSACHIDTWRVLVSLALALVLVVFFLLVLIALDGRIAIEDMKLDRLTGPDMGSLSAVLITTCQRHWVLEHRHIAPRVTFAETGIKLLRGSAASGSCCARRECRAVTRSGQAPPAPPSIYRVTALSRDKLALLTAERTPVDDKSFEASMGRLQIAFPRTLIFLCIPGLKLPLGVALGLIAALVLGAGAYLEPPASLALAILIASALVAAGLRLLRALWARTPLERRLAAYAKTLARCRGRGAPQASERGPGRAVQAGQLVDFNSFFETFILERTMYYVVANIVLPLTAGPRLSFAELVGPRQVGWFVSHFWGTPFNDFVRSIRCHAKGELARRSPARVGPSPLDGEEVDEEWRDVCYWVCALSNNQWRLEEEMGNSWEQSSFYLALRSPSCAGTAMILDNRALPLTRVWCLFELLQSRRLRPDDSTLLFCTSSGVLQEGRTGVEVAMALGQRLAALRLEEAHASKQADKDMIFELVQSMPGGFEAMNGFVRHSVRSALMLMKSKFDGDFQLMLGKLELDGAPAVSAAAQQGPEGAAEMI